MRISDWSSDVCSSDLKIVVVLSLLRNALGLQQVPPNVVINGLAIVLSIYVMYPVILDTMAAIEARKNGLPPPTPSLLAKPAPQRATAATTDPPDRKSTRLNSSH